MGSLPNISSHLSTYHLVDSHSFDLDMPVVGPGYASGWTWICQWLDQDKPVVGPGYAWLDLILLVRGRGEMSKMIENQQINLQSLCTSIRDSPSMQSRIDSRNVRPYFIRMHQSME